MLVSDISNKSVKPMRTIAVTGGKGGVGKTNVAVNLAIAMASGGNHVMLMDADLGLANVDVLLGLRPKKNLSHVLMGQCSLAQVLIEGPQGLYIVPASSGLASMADMAPAEHAGVIRAFSELRLPLDTLIIDTAAGIAEGVVSYTKACQEVMVVVCDEPASITDAYGLIKLLSAKHGIHRFHVVCNMAASTQSGRELFKKLQVVTDKYLDVILEFAGVIPQDEYLRKAVKRQSAVIEAYPRSKSSLAFKKLAQKADSWPIQVTAGSRLEFFVERLVTASQKETGVSL